MKNGQLLVHVEPGPVSERRLRYALSMAQNRDMKLIGLTVQLSIAAAVAATGGEPFGISALCDASLECCRSAKQSFDRVTNGCGIEIEWREVTGIPLAAITAEAGRADIVIVGRNDRVDDDSGMYRLAPADLIMGCGTPVMVVSDEAPVSFKARRILLAWKNTAQAARATRDALPLLKSAQTVVLTEAVSDRESDRYAISAEVMAAYLGSHGIEVSIRRLRSAGDAGSELIQAAADNECDLIVAGAYGHSRVREWVLGGVTRSLLAARTIPCILSH